MKKALFTFLAAMAFALACDNKTTSPPPVETRPIRIVSPDNGSTLRDSQYIQAVAGSGYSFETVDFYIDTLLVAVDSTYPYLYFWNIFNYDPDIIHPLYVIGNTADTTADSSYMSDVVLVNLDFVQGFSFAGTYQPGSQNALGVTNYYEVLFVSLGDAGVEMLDVRDKTAPDFLARYDTPGQALHTDVGFPFVYIADSDAGLTAADFSDVDSIMFSDVYDPQNQVFDVALSESFVIVAENDLVTVLDFQLVPLGQVNISQVPNYIVARHDTAFVVCNNSFYIIDCTPPSNPQIISFFDPGNLARAVAVADTFVFIANGDGGVIALSIDEPASPRVLAQFDPAPNIVAVDASDGLLFAGANSGEVYALSYNTPDTLIVVGNYTGSNLLEEIDYNANYLYVAAHTNVDILRFVP
jgi:hypothetical protein